MLNFTIDYSLQLLAGSVAYLPDDYAFQTVPHPPFWNSVLVNTLEITLDVNKRVTGVWGFCPQEGWTSKRLAIPEHHIGGVFCEEFSTFQSHIPINVDDRDWKAFVDRDKGWVCIGDFNAGCECVAVLPGLMLSIYDRILRSVWINLH